jgi:hypothetical protein
MHPWVFQACNDDDRFNADTLRALKTTDTLDDLLDILEGKAVRDSWSHADMLNNKQNRDRDAHIQEQLERVRSGHV